MASLTGSTITTHYAFAKCGPVGYLFLSTSGDRRVLTISITLITPFSSLYSTL